MPRRFVMPSLLSLVLVVALFSPPARADDGSAARLFDQGTASLEKAEFKAALKAFAAAARAAPENERYRTQYAIVRQNVQLRRRLDGLHDPAQWDRTALALRTFYLGNRIYSEALAVDRRRHERVGTADSASMLAETLLRLERNQETVELLEGPGKDQTPRTLAQRGIAWARLGETDRARLLATVPTPRAEDGTKPDPALCFDLACLHALLGNADASAEALTCCFKHTPSGQLPALKAYARMYPDLSGAVASDTFAAVWSTASLVKESSCSSGADCGTCPSRTSACDEK